VLAKMTTLRVRRDFLVFVLFSGISVASTPTINPISPVSAMGASQVFTFSFSDSAGYRDLGVLNILINNFLDGRQACYLAYSQPSNVLYLVNDPATALSGLPLNGAGSVSNSQCTISGFGSSAIGYGNSMTLTLNITFSAAFAGDKIIYMAGRDVVENNSGWQTRGIFKVTSGASTYPRVQSFTPNSGMSTGQTFAVTYRDAPSNANIRTTQILINDALDGRNACYMGYDRASNLLYLVSDGGSGLLPAITPSAGTTMGSGTQSNSQCILSRASVTTSGQDLTLSVELTFKSGFFGTKLAYAALQTASGGNSGWQASGSWIIPGPGTTAAPAPLVTDVYPPANSVGAPLNSSVVVRFTTPIVLPGVELRAGGALVPGDAISSDGYSVVYTPALPLSASTTYTVTANVTSQLGALMGTAFSSTFQTGTASDITAPTVVYWSPSLQDNIPINTIVSLRFDKRMNPATLYPTNMGLIDQVNGQKVPAVIQVDSDGLTANIVPQIPLAVGRQYYLSFNTSAIRDMFGHSVSNYPYVSFTTSFGRDTQGPTLTASAPSTGDSGVPTNGTVSLLFSERMSDVSIQNALKVTTGGQPVPFSLSSVDKKLFTLTFSNLLSTNATYLVSLTPLVTDLSGNALANPSSIVFTTSSAPDVTSPSISAQSPGYGAVVGTNVRIRLAFNKKINRLSINSSNFVVQSNSGVPVLATVNVEADGLSATLVPQAALTASANFYWSLSNFSDLSGHTAYGGSAAFTTSSGPDTTAPAVLTVSPANGVSGVPVNGKVAVLFSEAIDPTTLGTSGFRVLQGATPIAGYTNIIYQPPTVSFTPSSPLATSTTYTIQLSGYSDSSGNSGAPFSASFTTTGSATPDNTAPQMTSINPTNGSTGVALSTPIVITYNDSINPVSALSALSVSTSGLNMPGTTSVNGGVVTFTPQSPYPQNALVSISLYGLTDLAGNFATQSSSSFRTIAAVDSTPPVVTSVTPADAAGGQSPNITVVLTFSKALNPNTITSSTFALLNGATRMNSSVSWSPDGRTVRISPYGLQGGLTLTVVATHDVTDLSGNHLADFRSQFSTAVVDTTSPAVVTQRPGSGATGVSTNTIVTLFFSKPMNPATTSGALNVAQNGVLVPGTSQLTGNGQVLQFTPNSPFAAGSLVQVFVDKSALDTFGNPVYGYSGQFTITVATAGLPPAITRWSPSYGAPLNAIVEIEFDQDLDQATVNGNVTLRRSPNNSVVLATIALINGRVIRITPSALLPASTSYYAEISSGLRSAQGAFFNGYNPYFNTGTTSDTTAPSVSAIGPPNGATNVGVNATIRVQFSETVNSISVNSSTIQIFAGATAIPSSISFYYSGAATLTPQAPLPSSSQITVSVTGVVDFAGNPVIPRSVQFTTGSAADLVSPSVVSSNIPLSYPYATNIPVNSPLIVTFSEAIDPQSVNISTCYLSDYYIGTLPGSYSFTADLKGLSFIPAAPLAVGRSYSVNCGPVQDLSGNYLYSGLYGSFTASFSPDTTAPQVLNTNPANSASQAPINTQVQIQFSEPVQPATLSSVNLIASGSPVAITRLLSNSNQILTLAPAITLAGNTSYAIAISEVRDIAGNIMPGSVSRSFTTAASADLVSPTANINPANGAADVGLNVILRASFSEPINPFSLDQTTFYLSTSFYSRVPSTVTVAVDRMSVTLTPLNPLQPNTAYALTLSSFSDTAGNNANSYYNSSSFTTGSGPDNTLPSVLQVSPQNGVSGTPVNTVVQVLFSEPIDPTSLGANGFRLLQGATPIAGSIGWISPKSLTFRPSASLPVSTTYSIQINGITDTAGNVLPAFGSSFTTGGAVTPDTTTPGVISISPANAVTGVPVTTSVVVAFSEPINPILSANAIYLSSGGIQITGAYVISGATVTVTPDQPLPGSALISVSVSGVGDFAGNGYSYFSSQFTTAASTDTTPPAVLSVSPASGGTAAPQYTNIILTFSEALNPATVSNANFGLLSGATGLSTYVSRSPDSRTVTLNASLPASSTITVVASHNVTDLAGNQLPDFSSQFTTLAAADSNTPYVVSQTPLNGATNVAANSVVTLSMSKPMNVTSVQNAFHVSQNGMLVNGVVQVTGGGTIIQFSPAVSFSAGAFVQVFLENTAVDTIGIPVNAYNGQFTIAGTQIGTAFSVVRTSPSNTSARALPTTVLDVEFNKDLDPATVNHDNVKLMLGDRLVSGTLTLNNGRVIRFKPSGELTSEPGTAYRLQIGTGVHDESGLLFPGYEFTFSVGRTETARVLQPSIEFSSQAQSPAIHIRFSEPINPITATGATILLRLDNDAIMPASIAFSADDREVIISPTVDLSNEQAIHVTIDGVQDISGNPALPRTLKRLAITRPLLQFNK